MPTRPQRHTFVAAVAGRRSVVRSSLAGAVTLFLASAAPAFPAATLSVGEVELQSGQNGAVPVGFRGNNGTAVAAMQMDVLFDPAAYTATSAAAGTLPDSFRVDSHLLEPGRLRVVVGAANNAALMDGTAFNVPLTATTGLPSGFPLVLTNLFLSTAGSLPVTGQLAPQVRLLNLTSGGRVNGNGGVQLAIDAGATGSSLSRVEFFANGVKIGESTTAPFSLVWTPSGTGQFVLKVVAYDFNGLQADSRSIPVVVFFNRPPTTRPATLGAVQNTPVSIPLAKLLAFASDPDGDPLSVAAASAASTHNGRVTLGGGLLTYAPLTNYVGYDTFTYTISDGIDGTVTGTVSVTVSPERETVAIARLATGGFRLRFLGTPGAFYNVQFRNRLDGPAGDWAALNLNAPLQAGPDGTFTVDDQPNPAPTSRFYRLIKASQ